jgi:cupin superfamily acireductone dioxygenase involved in methionine salvage
MYHRFTLDDNKYAIAMRLFVKSQKEPIWTPVNRDANADSLPCRQHYLDEVMSETLKAQ